MSGPVDVMSVLRKAADAADSGEIMPPLREAIAAAQELLEAAQIGLAELARCGRGASCAAKSLRTAITKAMGQDAA